MGWGLVVGIDTINIMVSACETGHHWQRALMLSLPARHLSDGEGDDRGAVADGLTYGALVGACAKGFQWKHASALLSEIRSQQQRLNIIFYNAALDACAKCRHWELAVDMLCNARCTRASPDLGTYNAAVLACEGQPALLLLDEMHALGLEVNVEAYTNALSSWPSSVQHQSRTLAQMRETRIEPDEIVIASIVDAFVQGKRVCVDIPLLLEQVARIAVA